MATPFREDESLDLAAFGAAIAFMRQAGCQGCTITGVLGESNRLLDSERAALIETAVGSAGDMPICVGTSHPGSLATRGLSDMAEELGAAAVMVTPSREPTPLTDDRMVEYFSTVADGITIPIVLQDHPGSTQVSMGVPLLARLVNEIPGIACVKLESLPTPVKIPQLRALIRDDCTVLTGLGALYGGFDLEAGSDGFMTGFAFPEVLSAMVQATKGGDAATAWAVYERWLPMIVYEQQPSVAVRKEVYRLRGLLDCNTPRHPAATIAAYAAEQLRATIERVLPATATDASLLHAPLPLELVLPPPQPRL
jgi:4-hydroxy-tetrahydrodipicolinate synthase